MSKRGAQVALGRLAQPADLPAADHVGQRLAGPADVAVHLVGDVGPGGGGVAPHEVDGPGAGPAVVVHAGVHHQAAGPPARRTTACPAAAGPRCTGPSRRPAARSTGPSPRRSRTPRRPGTGGSRAGPASAPRRSAGDGRACSRGRPAPRTRRRTAPAGWSSARSARRGAAAGRGRPVVGQRALPGLDRVDLLDDAVAGCRRPGTSRRGRPRPGPARR